MLNENSTQAQMVKFCQKRREILPALPSETIVGAVTLASYWLDSKRLCIRLRQR